MVEEQQFTTFYLDGLYFGIGVLKVQEVIKYQPTTRVPLAPTVVRGLINLRGQIVTAIDLRRRLGLSDRPDDELPMNVVVRTDDGVVSLLVDEIGDVIEASDATFEAPPANLTGPAREHIRGVYKLRDRLLLVLDAEKVVSIGDDLEQMKSTAQA